MTSDLEIYDTTLRDGEQAPGCSMTLREKLRVAKALADLNVDIIEAGFPAASPGDFDAVKAMRWQPAIRIAPPFHDESLYIGALETVARRHLAGAGFAPERVIISFHGLPQRYFDLGDPYHCHCAKTARLLREKMGWTEEFAPLAFQSKFGREKWLEPATEDIIKKLAGEGVKKLAVITPGFVSDCIETLEEIDMAGRETFMEAGGEAFTAIPCLNDAPEMTALLESIARRETAGWV